MGAQGGWLSDMPAAGGIFSTAATGLAVLLAFLIVATFDSYQTGRDATGTEAVAVQQPYAMARYFDEPLQPDQLHGDDALLRPRRRLRRAGRPCSAAARRAVVQDWVDAHGRGRCRCQVVTDPKQIEAFAHWFDVNKDRQEGRRSRLAEAQPFVPGFLWGCLALLTLVVLGYQILLRRPQRSAARPGGRRWAAMALTALRGPDR